MFVKSWMDAAVFVLETQGVIAMRLMKIASGGPGGAAECRRMFFEKVDAASSAHNAACLALAGGKSLEAAAQLAIAPVKRRVRANYVRLLANELRGSWSLQKTAFTTSKCCRVGRLAGSRTSGSDSVESQIKLQNTVVISKEITTCRWYLKRCFSSIFKGDTDVQFAIHSEDRFQ
jgi:hypothetical protein